MGTSCDSNINRTELAVRMHQQPSNHRECDPPRAAFKLAQKPHIPWFCSWPVNDVVVPFLGDTRLLSLLTLAEGPPPQLLSFTGPCRIFLGWHRSLRCFHSPSTQIRLTHSSFSHTQVFSLIESLHVESYLRVCILENRPNTVTTKPWVKHFSPGLTVPSCEIRMVAEMLSKGPFCSRLTFQLELGHAIWAIGLILKIPYPDL